MICIYLDLPKGAKCLLKAKGVSINHPLGFIWHPLEGAGIYIYSNYHE